MGKIKGLHIDMKRKKTDTIIIGAGISGLSTAHFLSKKNSQFLVLESSDRVGGIIQSKKIKEFICEMGPNTVLLNNDSIIQIVKDLNLSEMLIFPNKENNKGRYVYNDGKIEKIPLKVLDFLKSNLISFKSKILLLKELFIKKHKEDTSVYKFIKKRFGKEIHDKLIEPFLSGVYAGDTRKMSTKYALKILWKLEQTYGSIIKGSFLSSKSSPKSFTFPGGQEYMINKIYMILKKRIILNSSVTLIRKIHNSYEVFTKDGKKYLCKNIVSTVPSYVLEKIIDDHHLKSELKNINYNPIDVFHFGFKKKNIMKKLDGFGILTKPSDNKNFLGILFNSSIFKHLSSEECELFTVLVGGEKQKHLCSMEINELKAKVLKEVESIFNHQGETSLQHHYRWEKGIPQYNLNHGKLNSCIQKFMTENKNFFITGNYVNGVSVSDCIHKGKEIADEILTN